jgi:hypothetical protein
MKPSIPRPFVQVSFDAFIASLDAWETDILRHTELFVDSSLLCLEAQHRFRAVSDGSVAKSSSASFGWILSTAQGERVAQNMGPVRGKEVHSYRAEAVGVLSILRFLIRIAEFTKMHEGWKGVVATDGQSLLDTLEGVDNARRRRNGEPVDLDYNKIVLDVLSPEWDILVVIQHSLKCLPGITLKYIKGHQDSTIPYDQL